MKYVRPLILLLNISKPKTIIQFNTPSQIEIRGKDLNFQSKERFFNGYEIKKRGTYVIKIFYQLGTQNKRNLLIPNSSITKIIQWGNTILNWQYAFLNCSNLKYIKTKDTPRLLKVSAMFSGCNNLKNIKNIENWNVSNVTDLTYMFYDCYRFNGDLTKWDVSNVKFTDYVFYNCYNFEQDLSNWNLINLTPPAQFMFLNCKNPNTELVKTLKLHSL